MQNNNYNNYNNCNNIIMFVSLNKWVFVVEEVASFQEVETIKSSALS